MQEGRRGRMLEIGGRRGRRQEIGGRRQEAGDRRQERQERQETGDRRQEARNMNKETRKRFKNQAFIHPASYNTTSYILYLTSYNPTILHPAS